MTTKFALGIPNFELSVILLSVVAMQAGNDEFPCAFGTLFTNKNVPHILENIFFYLDYESYKTCLEVSQAWKKLLTSESYQTKGKSVFRDKILADERHLHFASRDGDKYHVRRILSTYLVDVNSVWGDNNATPVPIICAFSIDSFRPHANVIQHLHSCFNGRSHGPTLPVWSTPTHSFSLVSFEYPSFKRPRTAPSCL